MTDKKGKQKLDWKKLGCTYPNIFLPQDARKMEANLNVHNLVNKSKSAEWIDLQRNGWMATRIFIGDEKQYAPIDTDTLIFKTMPLDNENGDAMLFEKKIK